MDVFRKLYGDRFIMPKLDEKEQSVQDDNSRDNSRPTESNDFNQNESNSTNNANNEEMIGESDMHTIPSIKKNKKKPFIINPIIVYGIGEQNSTTQGIAQTITKDKTDTKKKGPKTKGSTESVIHDKFRPENCRCRAGTAFMNIIFVPLQNICKKYNLELNRINFKEQFGYNTILFNNFIKAKIYQIYGYKDDHNKKVIRIISEEKEDKTFIFLMSCTIEYLHNKYINGYNTISIDENEMILTPFNEVVEEKKKYLINKKKKDKGEPLTEEDLDDIEKEIECFIKYSQNFIKDIKEGIQKRQPKKKNICTYDKIDLFENYYDSTIKNNS